MASDLVGAGLLIAGIAAVFVVGELRFRSGTARPEWTRKFAHLANGMLCCTIPFVIQSLEVVLCLAISSTLALALARRSGLLKSTSCPGRKSVGVELFPAAILLAYVLAGDRTWLYLCAVLVMTFADGLAALVGGELGRLEYRVWGDRKTLEGSLVFIPVAFVCLLLPVALLPGIPVDHWVGAAASTC